MAKSISSRQQFRNELEKAGNTMVVANFHRGKGSSVEKDYILLNIDLEKHQDVANSQGIYAPTICCYDRKIKLTKLHVGFANADKKFDQIMAGYEASRKMIQTKKKPVEENNDQFLDSADVGNSTNHNETSLKTKLEDEISVEEKPVIPKNKAQHVRDFCVKILSTLEG